MTTELPDPLYNPNDLAPLALQSNDLLGLAPEREGQPRLYTAIGPVPEAGHWYSPAAVREMLAAERERWAERVEEAFREGYWARETYNDSEVSDADEKWASAKAALLRA